MVAPAQFRIAFLASMCSFLLLACDATNSLLKPIVSNAEPHRAAGEGLTRASFGPLNTSRLQPRMSSCNANLSPGLSETFENVFDPIVNAVRNESSATDYKLSNEELHHYFNFTGIGSQPVIRVLSRQGKAIDFWFLNDAVRESYKAEEAAQYYCGKNHLDAKYVGYSYKCGKPIKLPFNVATKQKNVDFNKGRISVKDAGTAPQPIDIKVLEEERIVAFDCVKP